VRLLGRSRGAARLFSFSLLLGALTAAPSAAQSVPVTHDSITLVPGPQFSTTSWIRWLGTPLFGNRYRALWNTPITLPVLDLAATGGGLRLSSQGTGRAAGLTYLVAADGSWWVFWPLDRADLRPVRGGILPASVISGLVADLPSGRHPTGPLVANALADAAGVPHQDAWLVARPAGGWPGALDGQDSAKAGYLLRWDRVAGADSAAAVGPGTVLTSLGLLHRLLQVPGEQVDAQSVLLASLFNVYVGNLNPRFLDWRWEAIETAAGIVWRPLGIFRETALARYDGFVSYLARPLEPDLVNFGPNYPRTLTGFPDQTSTYRLLLGSLSRRAWDSTAAALQERLTDSVITAAVGGMPAAYRAKIGERLIRILQKRRDNLPRAVDHMFRAVRGEVELYGTGTPDAVAAEWTSPDTLTLRFDAHDEVYPATETKRVTLFLGAGPDTVRFIGGSGRAPELRLVPGPAEKLVIEGDAAGRPVAVYGSGVETRVSPPGAVPTRSTSLSDALTHLDRVGSERTDGRRNLRPVGWLALQSGVGWLIGGGVVRTDWSGEARPYRSQVMLRAAYGSDSKSGVVQLLGDFRWAHSPVQLHLDAVASGVGATYFYGFGNETPGDSTTSYHRAGQQVYAVAPSLVLPLSGRIQLEAGLELKSVTTPLDTSLFIGKAQPYGSPHFGMAGLTGGLTFDSRDVRGAPRRGVLASLEGAWYPLIRDGIGQFGTITGSVATFLTPTWWQGLTVAARVSGTHTVGTVPYFEAAFVGGGRTVRGLPQGRYSGNQSVFGNLDVRLRVSKVQFVLPWDFGVLLLADAGRVFVTGEQSNAWHPSVGGGLWVALLDRSLAATVSVATGAGAGVFINAGAGFTF